MSSHFRFTCALDHGFHARPASLLAEALRPFAARVELVKESSGQGADARSVLSIVALNVARHEACLIRAEGSDAGQAIDAVRMLIESGLGEAAGGDSPDATPMDAVNVPAGLRRLGVRWIIGRGISPGFAIGPVVIVRASTTRMTDQATAAPEIEQAAADRAIQEVRQAIQSRVDASAATLERDLLRAHLGIASDPALRDKIEHAIRAGASAATAINQARDHFVRSLGASTSAYIRDRVVDVQDVCQQLHERLGVSDGATPIVLHKPSILVADLLTPRQVMQLDRRRVLALVLGRVGATSHTVILARSFGMPALVDAHNALHQLRDGQEVIVDSAGGFVLPDVTAEVRRYYAIGQRMTRRREQRLARFASMPAKTNDGSPLEIAANISTSDEVAHAMSRGAEGVGLFRTEMLFLDRPAPPDEQEQFEAYSQAVEHAGGKPIIFRTLDIGGDKPAPYLRLPREENPFLGCRGIRLYERFPDLIRAQLRAIARASTKGPCKVMAPMVSTAREAAWFRDLVRQVQDELRSEGVAFDPAMPMGVMIEVPAAAMAVDQLAAIVDFFSIGTNDLCQYFLAADRGNPRVASLCDPLEPSFLRLLRMIVDAAHVHEKWIGVCGEMAGDPRNLPLMVGLSVDEISVAPANVLELKASLASLDAPACCEFFNNSLVCRDAGEVRALLGSMSSQGKAASVIEADLVIVDCDAASKTEAIRELVGLVDAAGRAHDPHALECAVWAREDTYSTGLGFGFAIPHCKSSAVRCPTIAVLKSAKAIDWGSTDGLPVRVAILLAIPEADAATTHMQLLAKLARRLMHEEFRDQLQHAASSEAVVAVLKAALEP